MATLVFCALIGVLWYAITARAGVAVFHPLSCLGNWRDVQNALGSPDLSPDASSEQFTDENSARLSEGSASIFCGNVS